MSDNILNKDFNLFEYYKRKSTTTPEDEAKRNRCEKCRCPLSFKFRSINKKTILRELAVCPICDHEHPAEISSLN